MRTISDEINLKHIKLNESPKLGSIMQIKENVPRRSWKIAKIVELTPNSDASVIAAKILLPNIVNRPLYFLYPLECETKRKLN